MPIIPCDTGDQNLPDPDDHHEPPHVTAFHMQTIATLDQDQHTLHIHAHVESHVQLTGFHGGCRAYLLDANSRNIYMTPKLVCGTEPRIVRREGRDCDWNFDIPVNIAQATQRVAVTQYWDPHNIIVGYLDRIVANLTWDEIKNTIADVAPYIIMATS